MIKVEPPDGDIIRRIVPGRSPGMGGMFLTGNRSKRSIVLDLKRPGGHAAFLRLAVLEACTVMTFLTSLLLTV